MYPTLPDILLTDGAQQQLATDCRALVDQELAAKSGASGATLKVAYKAVTAIAPGYYQNTVENMIPGLLRQLQPFWADFHAAGGGVFGDYLVSREDEVSEAILRVSDDMVQGASRGAVVKAYKAVRGGAGKHVKAALPAVGLLVEKYAA